VVALKIALPFGLIVTKLARKLRRFPTLEPLVLSQIILVLVLLATYSTLPCVDIYKQMEKDWSCHEL
jgi:hypothetical protein